HTYSYNFLWSPGSGLNAVSTPNPTATPNETTTYHVVVTDALGCSSSSDVVVTVHENPTASAGLDRIYTECPADTLIMGGSPTATGGTSPYMYQWSPSTALVDSTVANPQLAGLNTDTRYFVTVTDANNCTASATDFVFVAPSTLQASAGNNGAICSGSLS